MTNEENKNIKDDHKNVRDEQFWFTAAVVGFNSCLLARADVSVAFATVSSFLVSIFGTHLILSRWVAGAGRSPADPPIAKTDRWIDRLSYTLKEIRVECAAFFYILAELSGSCFYLLLILLGFIGVCYKYGYILFVR